MADDRQDEIRKAVSLNNASHIMAQYLGEADKITLDGKKMAWLGGELAAENIASFTTLIAGRFLNWLRQHHKTEQEETVISEVTQHFAGKEDKPVVIPDIKETPKKKAKPRTHVNCTQCGTLVKMGQVCSRPECGWDSDNAKDK